MTTISHSKALQTASRCRHYAMCKIDYLGSGGCPSGERQHFVAYYPQGLMDLTAAVLQNRIPVTTGLVDVVNSCTLCGVCDSLCYFVTELRPLQAIKTLKTHLGEYLRSNQPIEVPADDFLHRLRAITGAPHATNDPAHLVAYANDPCPISIETMPRYAVVPANATEISAIVKLCRQEGVAYAVRGNGSSVMGFVFSRGVVIDTARMKQIEFDLKNRAVTIGAGVSAFELQQGAIARGYRVNAAEPAALYCANIMCSGIFSLFSSSYGTAADNIIDAEFVAADGSIFALSEKGAPNLFAFRREELAQPGICTRAVVKLHPVHEDDAAIAVPFSDLNSATAYAGELNRRNIGLGIGVLGGEYLSTFIAPTVDLAASLRTLFKQDLGIAYLVIVLGNSHHLDAARQMAPVVFEQALMTALMLGMPTLAEHGLLSVLTGLEGQARPYELLADPAMLLLIEAALDPSAEQLAAVVDSDLRDFYTRLYSRPELTDMLWLNTFRIVSSRMGRDGHVVAFILYVPLDDIPQIEALHDAFSEVAENCGVRGEFGFLTPLDQGAMAVLEWDMYLDHTDPAQVEAMQRALAQAGVMIEEFSRKDPRVLWIRYVFNQGFARKESFLYHGANLR